MEVKLSGDDYTRVESINVSANGVYFTSAVYIPTLTKLQITLLLPESGNAAASNEVTCEGVVVRTDPDTPSEDPSEYEVACYFTSISETSRGHLESYILNQLAF